MKRMLMALAVAGIAAAGSARADWGGYGPPSPQGGYPVAASSFNDPNTLLGLGASAPGHVPDRYGLMPSLKKAFHVGDGCTTCGGKKPLLGLFSRGGCSTCGDPGKGQFLGHGGGFGHGGYGYGGAGYGGGYGGPGYGGAANPTMMQGTLVFPHHTFVRSPRDYFMYEPGR